MNEAKPVDVDKLRAKWRRDLGKVLGDELVIEIRRRGAGELLYILDALDQAVRDNALALAVIDSLASQAKRAEDAIDRVQELCMTVDGDWINSDFLGNTVGDIRRALDGDVT